MGEGFNPLMENPEDSKRGLLENMLYQFLES